MLTLQVDSGVAKPHRAGAIPAPQSRVRGGLSFAGESPPTPKETASYLSTANYIVVIE